MKLLQGRKIQSLDAQVNKEPSTLPKLSFIMYLVASRGSGKTVALTNLLINRDMLAGKFNEIYFISPTASLDSKLNVLKTTNGILAINQKLIAAVKKLSKNGQTKVLDDFEFQEQRGYTTSIPKDNFISNVDEQFLNELIKEQKAIIQRFGK